MPTFLVTYHGGGGPPATPEAREQMMAAFGAWVASTGDNMIDPGAPLGPSKVVTSDSVTDGTPGGGYTMIRADSLDDAVNVVEGHPFLTAAARCRSARRSRLRRSGHQHSAAPSRPGHRRGLAAAFGFFGGRPATYARDLPIQSLAVPAGQSAGMAT